MAFYLIERTDVPYSEDPNELRGFMSAVVRAKGRLQAQRLITRPGSDSGPMPGVQADGSNLTVTRLEDGRDVDNAVIVQASE